MRILLGMLLQAAFYPQTVAVKLLKGMVECPSDPSDPVFEVFAGDVADTAALLQASALSMTLTHADSVKLMFSVEPKLKQWVANAEVATICMTQEGLKNPTQTCWENERCTQFLGYMRWTGKDASPAGDAALEPYCMWTCGAVREPHECKLCVALRGSLRGLLVGRFS